jgi:nucleotide-binding universal stress UspA family protein
MFRNVLVGVDGHDGGRDAIALAAQFAAPGARITLAHVYDYEWTPGSRQPLGRLARHRKARELLEHERATARIDARVVPVGDAKVATGLCGLAAARDVDLIVIGSSRRGAVGRVLLGDDTAETVEAAPCPVAVAPHALAHVPAGTATPEHLLVLPGRAASPDSPDSDPGERTLVGASIQEGA